MLTEAIRRFREAGMTGDAAACLHTLSLALGRMGKAAEAQKAVEESIALSRALGDRRQESIGLRRLGIIAENMGDQDKGEAYTRQALALHRELGDRAQELNALNNLGIWLARSGRLEEAGDFLRQALALAEAIDSRDGIVKGISTLFGIYYRATGNYGAGLKFIEEQAAGEYAKNDEFIALTAKMNQCVGLTTIGQFDKAIELAQSLDSAIHRLLGQAYKRKAYEFLGYLYTETGHFAQARQILAESRASLDLNSTAAEHADVLLSESYVALQEGGSYDSQPAKPALLRAGLDQAQQALSLLTGLQMENVDEQRANALHLAARLSLDLGDFEQALTCSTEVAGMLDKLPVLNWPEQILFTHARALQAVGRDAEAGEYLRRAYNRVMLIADSLDDETLRRSLLENVRQNRAIVAAWEEKI
jgi:tetratricopeptide (TPR) repeat protein